MALVFLDDKHLSDIADAIRTKSGSQDSIKPSEMADEIENLPSGGSSNVYRVSTIAERDNLSANDGDVCVVYRNTTGPMVNPIPANAKAVISDTAITELPSGFNPEDGASLLFVSTDGIGDKYIQLQLSGDYEEGFEGYVNVTLNNVYYEFTYTSSDSINWTLSDGSPRTFELPTSMVPLDMEEYEANSFLGNLVQIQDYEYGTYLYTNNTWEKLDDIDWSAIGYTEAPFVNDYYFNIAKNIYNNWDATVTSGQAMFKNVDLLYFPNVDTSNMTNMKEMFYASTVKEVGNFDFSSCTNATSMFQASGLVEIGNVETAWNCTTNYMFRNCFYLKKINKIVTAQSAYDYLITGCTDLVVNELDIADYLGKRIFDHCTNLDVKKIVNPNNRTSRHNLFVDQCTMTNTTIDEFLKFFQTLTAQSSYYKQLKNLGFTSDNATQATQSQYWQALVNAGWTTGY